MEGDDWRGSKDKIGNFAMSRDGREGRESSLFSAPLRRKLRERSFAMVITALWSRSACFEFCCINAISWFSSLNACQLLMLPLEFQPSLIRFLLPAFLTASYVSLPLAMMPSPFHFPSSVSFLLCLCFFFGYELVDSLVIPRVRQFLHDLWNYSPYLLRRLDSDKLRIGIEKVYGFVFHGHNLYDDFFSSPLCCVFFCLLVCFLLMRSSRILGSSFGKTDDRPVSRVLETRCVTNNQI